MTDPSCVFCTVPGIRMIAVNTLAFAIQDGFPVTPRHTLVIPKRHLRDYFDLTRDELLACDDLLRELREQIRREDPLVAGFNIGMNCGEVSGQTVMHAHIHLIPRRKGDTPKPRGGVRGVIPTRMDY